MAGSKDGKSSACCQGSDTGCLIDLVGGSPCCLLSSECPITAREERESRVYGKQKPLWAGEAARY